MPTSKEGERGTHGGFTLFFLRYAIVKTIQVLIGRREGVSESLLHLKGGDGVCLACATADGIGHATAGQFAMGMTAYAVAKHQNGLLGCDLLGIGEEGIFLIGLLPISLKAMGREMVIFIGFCEHKNDLHTLLVGF